MNLADEHTRFRATTVADRNLVVIAGAGTGKTTVLVDRILSLLFRPGNPLDLRQIVALTFTNKAANEMKARLRRWLQAMRLVVQQGTAHARQELSARDEARIQELLDWSGLAREDLAKRAAQALDDLDKGHIGTIHSFAAHLLRVYPLQAGVAPVFIEDEGPQLETHFEREWADWLDAELGESGTHHEIWRAVLGKVSVADVKDLAWALLDELIPLDHGTSAGSPYRVGEAIRQWLENLATEGQRLLKRYSTAHVLENTLNEAVSLLEYVQTQIQHKADLAQVHEWSARHLQGYLDRTLSSTKRSAWDQADIERARMIIRAAQDIRSVDGEILPGCLQLLVPFVKQCRQSFIESGFVSFSGLVARARNIVRDFPEIRRELKQRVRAILVDEFQDTDPVQYELILFLSEAAGHEARQWRELTLEAGKLFIVGDPKQSIYAFRRADLEAFDTVVNDVVLGNGTPGEVFSLQTNFRSLAALINPVNACFERLLPAETRKGLQPKFEPLHAYGEAVQAAQPGGFEVRLVTHLDEDADADAVTRAEAEELARWLKDEVLDLVGVGQAGSSRMRPRDVAVVFRTLTQTSVYLEAFRRHDIPYLTDGEKHFYERQEVIDMVNILRAVLNPDDRLALVGVLRSPAGAMTDHDIEGLVRRGKLDYRLAEDSGEGYPPVFMVLNRLRTLLPVLPLDEVMDAVWAHLPSVEWAAASMDGEQAMGNVLKLRDIVNELARRPDMTFARLVMELAQCIEEPPNESERSLGEEEQEAMDGAVQVLSIHKAKGLEFPMVVVAGLHRGTARSRDRVFCQHDWSSGALGVGVGDLRTLDGVYVSAKMKERERAEQVRLLYVAMTRAKQRLVLSSGVPTRGSSGSGSFLDLVARGIGLDLETIVRPAKDSFETKIPLGGQEIPVHVIPGVERKAQVAGKSLTWSHDRAETDSHSHWNNWLDVSKRGRETLLYGSPTSIGSQQLSRPRGGCESESVTGRDKGLGHDSGAFIGILAHRILEEWDFARGSKELLAHVNRIWEQADATEFGDHAASIKRELDEMFLMFGNSPVYQRLQQAEILGQEMPFLMPWKASVGEGTSAPELANLSAVPVVMEGVIDLIYRVNGQVWIADYKTDRVQRSKATDVAARYRMQARIYAQSVAQVLQCGTVRSEVIFLRTSQSIEVT